MRNALNSLIGASMRIYRRSPFYPTLGRSLASVLNLYVRLRKEKRVIHEVSGVLFELDLEEAIDASLYYSGTFEEEAERKIASLVRADMVAIDIGANVGYHTFRLAQLVGPNGSVHAIEPTSRAFAKLERNAGLNPFTNISLHRIGLSDKDYGSQKAAFESSYRLDGRKVLAEEDVPLVCFDSFARTAELKQVDFIKMDVDGFESRVFAGSMETLAKYKPAIYFEFGILGIEACGDNPEAVFNMLGSLGYSVLTDDGETVTGIEFIRRKYPNTTVNLTALPNRGPSRPGN